jgi:hypothetical protein
MMDVLTGLVVALVQNLSPRLVLARSRHAHRLLNPILRAGAPLHESAAGTMATPLGDQ